MNLNKLTKAQLIEMINRYEKLEEENNKNYTMASKMLTMEKYKLLDEIAELKKRLGE